MENIIITVKKIFRNSLPTLPLAVALFFTPRAVSAQIKTVGDVITQFSNLLDLIFPVVVSLAVLGFFWGLTQYIWKAGDKEAKEEGRRIMIAGVLGLFLIVAIGGIVDVLMASLDLSGNTTIPIPSVGTNSGP
jgi:hypothetical protein